MSEDIKSFNEKYLEFFIENQYWPSSYSYAITDCIIHNSDNKEFKTDKDNEMVCRWTMGYMCSMPINISVVESFNVMITFKVEYLDFEDTFNVYAPTNVSPSEFQDRIREGLKKIFFVRTGHETFDAMKNHFLESQKKMFAPIGKAIQEYDYKNWLELRNKSKDNEDEPGYGLCYCGHTKYCECTDPSLDMFNDHVKNGNIKTNDPNNGWKELKEE